MSLPPLRALPLLLPVFLAAASLPAAEPDAAGMKFFEKEVRPVLVQRCVECHGAKKQKGDLRLDEKRHVLTGGGSGPALVAGRPDESLLIKAVRRTDPDFEMPPKEKLSAAEVAVLEKWVAMGAPWPEGAKGRGAVDASGFSEEDRKFWVFQPLSDPEPPAKAGAGWALGAIDRFVAQKHAELKLTPAPEAGRAELIRRLSMDLHGLPPSIEQVRAFEDDADPRALEKLVDGLLASPRYGERWGQHWLDLVRYAESDGYNQDGPRSEVWRYRDWVIRSLNADMPYDQFVRAQLAGDEIAPEDPETLIATAYLRHPVYEYNQRDVRGQWEIILNDITDTTGELFLGLSFGCARCHNHKFDPILQKDYFRLRAFFTPVQWRDDLVLASTDQKREHEEQLARWEHVAGSARAKLEALTGPLVAGKARRAAVKFNEELQAMIAKSPGEREPLEKQLAGLCERQIERERRDAVSEKSFKDEAVRARYVSLHAELKKLDHLKPKPLPEAFVATDVGAVAPPTILKTRRGEQEVAPGFLTLLEPGDLKLEPMSASTGRRSALAQWITRPDNRLSTRVMVNRVWQYHFGRGIVGTSSDFGHLGDKPTHPELLDWLARRFVEDGWSLKKLHRRIVLSATYRQTARREPPFVAAQADPGNRYLWRFEPRRLDAEQLRDALLTVSGELDLREGGPSEDGNSKRRSVYTTKKRNSPNELLRSLDAPMGFASAAERQSTTTPTQALLMINSDWVGLRARGLAARAKTVDQAWMHALGRLPDEYERAQAEAFLKAQVAQQGRTPAVQSALMEPMRFHENTAQERLVVSPGEREGDAFSIESVFALESIDVNAAVRTLASRWSLGKDSVEAYGWSLGITGEKSRFQPRNLIVQLVGEDENANINYEVVASGLHVELGRRYHLLVRVSCTERRVVFRLRDLTEPDLPWREASIPHAIAGRIGAGSSPLVIGGLGKRVAGHHFDGRIEGLRLDPAPIGPDAVSVDPLQWGNALVRWVGKAGAEMAWVGVEAKGDGDPSRGPLADLCLVLLNGNEFFYLH